MKELHLKMKNLINKKKIKNNQIVIMKANYIIKLNLLKIYQIKIFNKFKIDSNIKKNNNNNNKNK